MPKQKLVTYTHTNTHDKRTNTSKPTCSQKTRELNHAAEPGRLCSKEFYEHRIREKPQTLFGPKTMLAYKLSPEEEKKGKRAIPETPPPLPEELRLRRFKSIWRQSANHNLFTLGWRKMRPTFVVLGSRAKVIKELQRATWGRLEPPTAAAHSRNDDGR